MSLCELYTEAITETKARTAMQFIAGILCLRIYLRFALGLHENELHTDNHSLQKEQSFFLMKPTRCTNFTNFS